MNRNYQTIGLLLAPFLVFSAGYYLGQRDQRTEVRTEYKDRTVYQDRVIVRAEAKEEAKFKERTVVKPDGTRITEKSVSQAKSTQAEGRRDTELARTAEASKYESFQHTSTRSEYSLGLSVQPDKYRDLRDYEIRAGRRLLGGVWAEGSYGLKSGFKLGLRLEW